MTCILTPGITYILVSVQVAFLDHCRSLFNIGDRPVPLNCVIRVEYALSEYANAFLHELGFDYESNLQMEQLYFALIAYFK